MVTVKLRNIGNSKGIIIPKEMIAQCDMEESVTLEVKGQQLIIRKAEHPDIHWDTAFQYCHPESEKEKIDAQINGRFPKQI